MSEDKEKDLLFFGVESKVRVLRPIIFKLVWKTIMFNKRDKIIKKDGQKPTDLEEEVAKSLHSLELNNKPL